MTDIKNLITGIGVAFFLLACSGNQYSEQSVVSGYSITLFRHAEKAAGDDPDLTGYGHARARFIAGLEHNADIGAIWTSDYRRTRSTAKPLADRTGVEMKIYNPRKQQELLARLLSDQVNAVVVGHSNTIPELAAMLCECEVAPMEETDYERSFRFFKSGEDLTFNEIDLRQLWIDRPPKAD